MHNQVLVIHPQNVELEDIMYPYQEVDKYPNEKMNDERCQWFLTVPEEKIPLLEEKIEEYLLSTQNKYLEVAQYRTEHSYENWKEKYGAYTKDSLDTYIYFTNQLNKFNEIRNLPNDNPKKITFFKEYGDWAIDKPTQIYIKGKGYGFFHNPYQIWDYYTIVNERRFSSDVNFLIATDGVKYNTLLLDVLDIPRTVENILELTRVWEYIIFCEKDPSDSQIYTIDDIRFNYEWNKHCMVDNLPDVLKEIQEKYITKGYMITALDFHW